eukprot:366336-Chlamydomonas_euryale.AAC.6
MAALPAQAPSADTTPRCLSCSSSAPPQSSCARQLHAAQTQPRRRCRRRRGRRLMPATYRASRRVAGPPTPAGSTQTAAPGACCRGYSALAAAPATAAPAALPAADPACW